MHYRHGRKEQPAACRLEKTPGGCDLIKKQTKGGKGGGGAMAWKDMPAVGSLNHSPTYC